MLMNLEGLLAKHGVTPRGVIHIGAHDGFEYPAYKKMDLKKILMFEPQPHLAQIVRDKTSLDPTVIVEQVAIGETPGELEMYIETANNGASSSLLKPKLHLEQYPGIEFNSRLSVKVVSLNDYFAEHDIAPYNVINMDIQGYELKALRGARNILGSLDAIYTEVNRAELYEGCCQIVEIDTILSGYGYVRKEIDWSGHTWGDALYVRSTQ